MEKIISNPGLQHLAENIFWNLDAKDLKICAQINQSCKQILQNPIFCLRKFEHISKKNQEDWIKVIQSVKNSDKGIAIISYLKWNLKKEAMNPLCYSSLAVQNDFRKQILECCTKEESCDEDIDIVKILAPLTENPNAPDKHGNMPIHWAARNGHTEIIKILVTLIENPNVPNRRGYTLIHLAACSGHTEIVKILAPLTNNPNAPNRNWRNFNFQDNLCTPIHIAARYGYTEIVKILATLTVNPNAPNKWGETPISVTKNAEIRRILQDF